MREFFQRTALSLHETRLPRVINPVRRVFFWTLLFSALASAAVDTSRDSPKEIALSLARKASRARKAGEPAQAYIYYAEAAALQPGNRRYRAQMELLQTGATKQSRPVIKPSAAEPIILAPDQIFDNLTARELSQARELESIPTLKAKAGRQDFNITASPRILFQRIAQAFGLDLVFDGEYPPSDPPVVFRVAGADYREALIDVQAATASFIIPLSGRLFMVAKDTAPKRTDLEQTIAVSIPIPQAVTTQEITEIAQVVRQVANVEKIAWDTSASRIVIRDRISRVAPALEILQQLLSYRPEVMIELEFLQVGSSDIVNYGFNITNSFTGIYLGRFFSDAINIPSGITSLFTLGGGRTLFGIAAAQVQAMFNQTTNTSDTLYRAQLRSVAGQPATLHVGERYPVITGGYTGGGATGTTGGVVGYGGPPIFTYENLGLEMKLTPFVHSTDEVSLMIETSFEVLTGQSINDIPVIGRRAVVSQARLRTDEWSIIGSLKSTTQSKGVNGFWGLGQIPILGNLFRQTSTEKDDSTVLIGIRPRLLSLPPSEIVTKRLRVGTDAHPYIPL